MVALLEFQVVMGVSFALTRTYLCLLHVVRDGMTFYVMTYHAIAFTRNMRPRI